jgi:hypothetical protein
MVSRHAAWLAGALVLLLAGCRRPTETWLEDLRGEDPWRRRMAVLALRTVEDGQCELAFRALVIRLKDRDPQVAATIEESLRVLSCRRPDLAVKALEAFAVERAGHRAFLARLLLELEQAGHSEVGPALREYLDGELASGVEARERAARTLMHEFGKT